MRRESNPLSQVFSEAAVRSQQSPYHSPPLGPTHPSRSFPPSYNNEKEALPSLFAGGRGLEPLFFLTKYTIINLKNSSLDFSVATRYLKIKSVVVAQISPRKHPLLVTEVSPSLHGKDRIQSFVASLHQGQPSTLLSLPPFLIYIFR